MPNILCFQNCSSFYPLKFIGIMVFQKYIVKMKIVVMIAEAQVSVLHLGLMHSFRMKRQKSTNKCKRWQPWKKILAQKNVFLVTNVRKKKGDGGKNGILLICKVFHLVTSVSQMSEWMAISKPAIIDQEVEIDHLFFTELLRLLTAQSGNT